MGAAGGGSGQHGAPRSSRKPWLQAGPPRDTATRCRRGAARHGETSTRREQSVGLRGSPAAGQRSARRPGALPRSPVHPARSLDRPGRGGEAQRSSASPLRSPRRTHSPLSSRSALLERSGSHESDFRWNPRLQTTGTLAL